MRSSSVTPQGYPQVWKLGVRTTPSQPNASPSRIAAPAKPRGSEPTISSFSHARGDQVRVVCFEFRLIQRFGWGQLPQPVDCEVQLSAGGNPARRESGQGWVPQALFLSGSRAVSWAANGRFRREAHISTKYSSSLEEAWLSCSDGHCWRPGHPESPAGQGPRQVVGLS